MPRLLLLLLVISALLLSGCNILLNVVSPRQAEAEAARVTGGDPEAGRQKIRRYGCQNCHTIPGVAGANGIVGPPLTGVANRVYLAGRLQNTPQNMQRWILNPRAVDPETAMPVTGVSEQDAKDISAYLYTLR